jgi:peptidoglycan/xylan/chitin deacetylase (PgdA/CDA1 family)
MKTRESCGRAVIASILAVSCILTTSAARGDAFNYSCSNCVAPDCICASTQPPGGLLPVNTPQIILLTFDDAVYSSRYETIQQVVTNHWNPNGTPIQATFFINTDWCDYRLVQQLYAQGHEIAVHTMTHTTDTNTDIATWRREIYGARKAMSDLAQIPLEEIVGFRAPNLHYNPESFQALAEAGMEYDASITESPGGLSTDGYTEIWPYTLDNGVAQFTYTGIAPTNPLPGLFEVPVWKMLDEYGHDVCSIDCSNSNEELLQIFKLNFMNHYTGNRAPMGIFLHAYWFTNGTDRAALVNEFISWALTNFYPDVWFVSTHSLVQFMKNPVDIPSAISFPPFITTTKSICPDEAVVTCTYTMGTFRTCSECPPAYPRPDTVFTDPVTTTDGVAWIEIGEHYANSYGASLGVSNNTDKTMADWEVKFDIAQGYLDSLWGGVYETNGQTVTVRPWGTKRPIRAGEVQTNIGFFVRNTGGNAQVSNFTVRLIDLTPKPPMIAEILPDEHGHIAMNWDNDEPGYRLMFTTNQNFTGWQPWAEIYGKTSTVANLNPDVDSGFFRLEVLP